MNLDKTFPVAVLVTSVALSILPASAATTLGTLGVSATVNATCVISPSHLSFAPYNGTATQDSATISLTCSDATPYTIGLDQGLASGATVATRQMQDGSGHLLSYALFRDSGLSANFGNSPHVDTVNGTGTGAAQMLTVYGRIPGAQSAVPGAYGDTVTVTITY